MGIVISLGVFEGILVFFIYFVLFWFCRVSEYFGFGFVDKIVKGIYF